MIKRIVVLMLCALTVCGAVLAEDDAFSARVAVESAHVRERPALEAALVASVFEDEWLDVIGRNADGTWFQVRRPNRMTVLGWVSYNVVTWDFKAEYLPLTDVVTSVTGDTPLSADTAFATFTYANVVMRDAPSREAAELGVIPHSVVVPVLFRDYDGSWLKVNYLGVEGWIAAVNVRFDRAVMDVPLAAGLTPLNTNVYIIPMELQLSETQALRDHVTIQRDFTYDLEYFWREVLKGETMPCEPPPFVVNYLYSDENRRAFPELEFLVPRLQDAVNYINLSIDPMYTCGVINPKLVREARNAATNARVVYDATLGTIDNVDSIIMRRR